MKKVTMQDIADALDTSRITVWKVLNNQPGVSDGLRNEILAQARLMKYRGIKNELFSDEHRPPLETEIEPSITVSVVVSRPDSSVFWLNIIHRLAKELTRYNINLMYSYLPTNSNASSYTLPSVLTDGTVHGMIILNVYDEALLDALNKLPIAKVFLDTVATMPVDSINGELFLLEGESTIHKITSHIIECGKKEIGFLGDINYARTNYDRYKGYLSAMKEHNLPVHQKNCFIGKIGLTTYQEEIRGFVYGLKSMPEAFVCTSDYVASFLLQDLSMLGYRIPDDILISGYDGDTEYPEISILTTVSVNIRNLGKRLVQQLLYRIQSGDTSPSVTYIYSPISWNESTQGMKL